MGRTENPLINTPGSSFKTASGDRVEGVVLMSLDGNGIASPAAGQSGGVASTVAIANFPNVQPVSGQSAVGSPPVVPPLSVSGVDGSGNTQYLLTDTAGRQLVSVQPSSVSAMSTAAVSTNSAQVLVARSGRRRLTFQNTGAGTITLAYGAGPAVVGSGIVLSSGGAANTQGGSWEEPPQECWAGAVQAIASAASTLTIVEG